MDTSFDATPDMETPPELERQPRATFDATVLRRALAGAGVRLPATPTRLNLELDLLPAVFTPGYAASHVDDLALTIPQRVTLKLLVESLMAQRAELVDGTRITRPQHAIQWLLEQLAIRLPSDVLDDLMERTE